MSIAETFYLLFRADASHVKQGVKEAEKSTDELKKSVISVDHVTERLGERFKDLVKEYGGVVASIFTLDKLVEGIKSAVEFADNIGHLSDALNVSTEDLSAWSDAVKQTGGSAEGFQSSIRELSLGLSEFATRGISRAAPFFESLGVAMTDVNGKARSVFSVLPDLANAFQRIGKQQSFGIGEKIGLDQGTILLLQKGRAGAEELLAKQRALGVVTKEDAEEAQKFNETWNDMLHLFRTVFVAVSNDVLPAFNYIIEKIGDLAGFLRSHSYFMTGLIIALGSAISIYLIPPLVRLAISAIAAFSPFLLVGALIAGIAAAFALAYDDIRNFIDGNDSLVGRILNKYPLVGKVVLDLIKIIKLLGSAIKPVLGFMFDGVENIFKGIIKLFGALGKGLGFIFSLVSKIPGLSKATDFLKELNSNQSNTSIADQVRNQLTGVPQMAVNLNAAKSNLALANATPLSSVNNANSRVNSIQTGPITVNTQATDATGIATSLHGALHDQIRQTQVSFDDGVMI